jgi:hypothetical protein
MGWVCGMHGEGEKGVQDFAGIVRRPRPIWRNGIRMDLREIG